MPQAPRPTAPSDPAVLTPGRSGTFAGFGGDSDPFAAAVRATGTPMIITNPRLTDNPLVFVNDAFCELTGYEREEVIGRNCRFLQGPQSDPAAVESIRAAVRLGRAIAIDVRNHRKDGSAFWNRLQMAPVHDAGGRARRPLMRVVLTSGRERPTAAQMPDRGYFIGKPYAESQLTELMARAAA